MTGELRGSEKGEKTERAISGRAIKIQYVQKENAPASSMLQIIRNLQNAARAAGGQVLDDSRGDNWYNTTFRLTRESKEGWMLSRPAATPIGSQLSNARRCSRMS